MLNNQDIKNIFTPSSKGKGGLPIMYEENQTYVCSNYYHNLIIGETGSKKSRLIAMPMVANLIKSNENCIITDPKGEIYKKTVKLAKDSKYEIIKLDFSNLDKSNNWDILENITTLFKDGNLKFSWQKIDELVNFLFASFAEQKDIFWHHAAISHISNMLKLYYLVENNKYCLKNFMKFFKTIYSNKRIIIGTCEYIEQEKEKEKEKENKKTNPLLTRIKRKIPEDNYYIPIKHKKYNKEADFLISNLSNFLKEDISNLDPTNNSIKIITETYFNSLGLNNNKLVEVLSKNDFNFNNINNKKTIIYLITPDYTNIFNVIAGAFINNSYLNLSENLINNNKDSLDIRLNYILDEFANIPKINNFDAYISMSRSKNIRFSLFIQNIGQLNKYGNVSEIILGNCSNIVYFYSKETNTIKYIHEYTKDLISLKGLNSLNKDNGEAIMILDRNDPYLAILKDIDEVI